MDGLIVFASWRLYLVHASLGSHRSATPAWHLDRFNRYCTAYRCHQDTDVKTGLWIIIIIIIKSIYKAQDCLRTRNVLYRQK